MFFSDSFEVDCILKTLFLPKTAAINCVWQAFQNYVSVWLL